MPEKGNMMLLIPIHGQNLSGIQICYWGGQKEETTGAYRFFENGTKLVVSIDDVREDDVDPEDILSLLKELGAIDDSSAWTVESVRDAEGLPMMPDDEEFTTITFTKKSI